VKPFIYYSIIKCSTSVVSGHSMGVTQISHRTCEFDEWFWREETSEGCHSMQKALV